MQPFVVKLSLHKATVGYDCSVCEVHDVFSEGFNRAVLLPAPCLQIAKFAVSMSGGTLECEPDDFMVNMVNITNGLATSM